MIRGCFPTSLTIHTYVSPLDALADCMESGTPDLVIAELNTGCETWLVALDAMNELPKAPRRLLLTEPGILDDVMHDTYRSGTDHVLLWPCTQEELIGGVRYLMDAPPVPMMDPSHFQMGLPLIPPPGPGGH
jgi:hypothetical protein